MAGIVTWYYSRMQSTREALAKLQLHFPEMINEVIDLTDQTRNIIFNMTLDEATAIVASGDPAQIATIEGHFAIMARSNHIVRMARSLQLPMRNFIAKDSRVVRPCKEKPVRLRMT